MTWKNNIFSALIFFTFSSVAHAQVFINEIMFNPEGSDSGREWVEVCATENFDLTDSLSFRDKSGSREVLHFLALTQGDGSLLKDECAIIASDAEKLKSDFPSLSANLLDATPNFSLLNSGESIAVLKDGVILDQVLYDTQDVPEGQSLHRNAQSFVPAGPTPGNKDFSASAPLENADTDSAENEQMQVRNITELPLYKFKVVELEPPQDIFLRVPDSLRIHSHELLELPVEIFDARGKAIDDARVTVSWGDFSDEAIYGQDKIFNHIYKHAGDYMILIKAKKQNLSDVKTIKVEVIEPKLELYFDKDKDILTFNNKSELEINLLNWKLKADGSLRVLPETLIAANGKLKVPGSAFITGLYHKREIKLMSPDAKFEIYAKKHSDSVEKQEGVSENSREQEGSDDLFGKSEPNVDGAGAKSTKESEKVPESTPKRYTKERAQNTDGAKESIFGYSVALASLGSNIDDKEGETESILNKTWGFERGAGESEIVNMKGSTESHSFGLEFNLYFVFIALSLGLFALLIYLFYFLKLDKFDDWTFEE